MSHIQHSQVMHHATPPSHPSPSLTAFPSPPRPSPFPPPFPPQGVGELWGGAYDARLPVPPRLLSLGQFANEAVDHDALVFVAMRGQSVLDGSVHRFLDLFGVHYTGSSAAATAAACSREVLAERLRPLEERGISTPPRVVRGDAEGDARRGGPVRRPEWGVGSGGGNACRYTWKGKEHCDPLRQGHHCP